MAEQHVQAKLLPSTALIVSWNSGLSSDGKCLLSDAQASLLASSEVLPLWHRILRHFSRLFTSNSVAAVSLCCLAWPCLGARTPIEMELDEFGVKELEWPAQSHDLKCTEHFGRRNCNADYFPGFLSNISVWPHNRSFGWSGKNFPQTLSKLQQKAFP